MFDTRAQRDLLVDGVAARLMDALTGGVFLSAIAIGLGASNLELGLLASLPFAAQAAQWLVAGRLLHDPRRKTVTLGLAAAGRLTLICLAVWLLVDPGMPSILLVVILAIATALAMASSVAWNWWMRDLIPDQQLGRYFGRRMRAASIGMMAVTLAAAFLAGLLGSGTRAAAAPFAAGAVLGAVGLAFLARVPHPEAHPVDLPPPRLFGQLGPDGRRMAQLTSLVSVTLGFALPFLAVYLLRSVGLSLLGATTMAVVSQLGYLAALRGWGHLADHHGHRPVLAVALGMLVAVLLTLAFVPPTLAWSSLLAFGAAHFVSGYAVGGILLATGNLELRLAPAKEVPAFLARISMARAASGGLAAIAGATAWQILGTGVIWDPGNPGGWEVHGFQTLAILSLLPGIAAIRMAILLKEPKARRVREVAVAMRKEARMMSSVAGIRAFVHTVSFIVEAFTRAPEIRPKRQRAVARAARFLRPKA